MSHPVRTLLAAAVALCATTASTASASVSDGFQCTVASEPTAEICGLGGCKGAHCCDTSTGKSQFCAQCSQGTIAPTKHTKKSKWLTCEYDDTDGVVTICRGNTAGVPVYEEAEFVVPAWQERLQRGFVTPVNFTVEQSGDLKGRGKHSNLQVLQSGEWKVVAPCSLAAGTDARVSTVAKGCEDVDLQKYVDPDGKITVRVIPNPKMDCAGAQTQKCKDDYVLSAYITLESTTEKISSGAGSCKACKPGHDDPTTGCTKCASGYVKCLAVRANHEPALTGIACSSLA